MNSKNFSILVNILESACKGEVFNHDVLKIAADFLQDNGEEEKAEAIKWLIETKRTGIQTVISIWGENPSKQIFETNSELIPRSLLVLMAKNKQNYGKGSNLCLVDNLWLFCLAWEWYYQNLLPSQILNKEDFWR